MFYRWKYEKDFRLYSDSDMEYAVQCGTHSRKDFITLSDSEIYDVLFAYNIPDAMMVEMAKYLCDAAGCPEIMLDETYSLYDAVEYAANRLMIKEEKFERIEITIGRVMRPYTPTAPQYTIKGITDKGFVRSYVTANRMEALEQLKRLTENLK